MVGAAKNDIYTNDFLSPHESKDVGSDRTSRANSSPPINESVSPLYKRSNIFKSKFLLSKINPPTSPKSAAEERIAPTVQMNDI